MPRKTPRPMRLQIKFSAPGATSDKVAEALIDSINRREYDYYRRAHPGWRVAIGWSNYRSGSLKWDSFPKAMEDSAASSFGFDTAVRAYLESQIGG